LAGYKRPRSPYRVLCGERFLALLVEDDDVHRHFDDRYFDGRFFLGHERRMENDCSQNLGKCSTAEEFTAEDAENAEV
jgi:hypothetical protein